MKKSVFVLAAMVFGLLAPVFAAHAASLPVASFESLEGNESAKNSILRSVESTFERVEINKYNNTVLPQTVSVNGIKVGDEPGNGTADAAGPSDAGSQPAKTTMQTPGENDMQPALGSGFYVAFHLDVTFTNVDGTNVNTPPFDAGSGMYGPLQIPALGFSMPGGGGSLWGGGMLLGYDLSPRLGVPLRVEAGYSARESFTSSGSDTVNNVAVFDGYDYRIYDVHANSTTKISTQTISLGLWADIPTGTRLTPYVGGGANLDIIKFKETFSTQTTNRADSSQSVKAYSDVVKYKNAFTPVVGAGLRYNLTSAVFCSLDYRYQFQTKITSDINAQNQTISMGVGYRF